MAGDGERWGARSTGVLWLAGGSVLVVGGYLLMRLFQGWAFEEGIDVEASKGLKLLGAMPALGLTAGLSMVYVGVTRVLFGERVAKIDLGRMSGAGILYVLGFAGVLVAALWFVVAVLEWDPFGG